MRDKSFDDSWWFIVFGIIVAIPCATAGGFGAYWLLTHTWLGYILEGVIRNPDVWNDGGLYLGSFFVLAGIVIGVWSACALMLGLSRFLSGK